MNNQIKNGDILFSYGKGFVQDLIEEITHGSCHTCVIVDDTSGTVNKVIEAQGFKNVGYADLSQYLDSCKIYRLPNTTQNINLGISWLFTQFGRGYDYWDIFVLFIRCALKLKLPWREGKEILCSRLTRDYIFQSKLNIPDSNMTPKDVEDWVIASGGVLIVDTVK